MEPVNRKITRSFSVVNWKPPDSQSHHSSGSSWKFWRRFSVRSRSHDVGKAKFNKERTESAGLLTKADIGEPLEPEETTTSVHGAGGLPDVLERAHALPVFNANAVPPPKPPRLFLVRPPSNEDSKSSSSESVTEGNAKKKSNEDTDVTPTYMNCERLKNLRSQLDKGNFITDKETCEAGENNNVIGKFSLDHVVEENSESIQPTETNAEPKPLSESSPSTSKTDLLNPDAKTNVDNNTDSELMASSSVSSPPPLSSSPSASPSRTRSSNHHYHSATTPRKPKIVTPELSHKRYGRSRRKSSSDKSGGQLSRQRHIMNSVMDLMCQRLDPYPLLDPLKRAGVLTNVHLQSFLGHRDRKSVCEDLADVIGKGSPECLSVFCAVMASCPGNCMEILEILQVMREIDRIIHDIPQHKTCDDDLVAGAEDKEELNPSLVMEEKNLNFDIGYLSTDYTLKPLVELGRVRSNTGDSSTKRLSTGSSRSSFYSLMEAVPGATATLGAAMCNNGAIGNNMSTDVVTFPGLVMMSISITGHSLAGERSAALAEVIRGHNCISELHLGKTHLRGQDVIQLTRALSEKSSTIHSLDLRLNAIGVTGAEAVTKLLRESRFLRILNLSSTELNNQSFREIVGAISSNKSLVEFDGSFLDITDECCYGLRDMLRVNTSLQKLRLRGNNLTHAGCQTLCEGLARNIGLSALDLSRNSIGDTGIQALAQYLPDSHVTDISVDGCGITAGGCHSLSEMVSGCKKLKHLDASTNELGDTGIVRLAPALERTSSVVAVSMNMCSITNDGFSKLLDVMEKNTSIQGLKLCYNKLGDQHSNLAATSENLRYRLRIVLSSRPNLKILLWGNSFDES